MYINKGCESMRETDDFVVGWSLISVANQCG